MKSKRKLWIAVMCCVLIIGLSATAFAVLQPLEFFSQKCGGRQVTGTGTISRWSGTATLNSKAISGEPELMDECYSSEAWVLAYDSKGVYIGATNSKGTVRATATYSSEEVPISYIACSFKFTGTDLGMYILRNG